MLKMIKKALALAMALGLSLGMMSPLQAEEDGKLRIVATVFPQYDWLKNVLGDRVDEVELILLQDSGVDLHNFQPSARDMMRVSSADLFVYIGGVSDNWVDDALSQAVNEEMIAVNLMKELGDAVKADVTIEGMQDDGHHHGHDHDHDDHDHDHEDEGVTRVHSHDDEHIWLSLLNAQNLTQVLADRLSRLDPDHASSYQKNAAAYIKELKALDGEYRQTVEAAQNNTLLFADRFPFRYLMDDYGLDYFAAFAGCSAETEASFETITFLSTKVDELALNHVLVLEGADKDLAGTVIANTAEKDQAVIVFDSMQSVDRAALNAGVTYLGIMEANLQALATALQ